VVFDNGRYGIFPYRKTMTYKIFPVFIPFVACPHRCIYCNQNRITNTTSIDWDITLHHIANFIQRYSSIDKEIAFFGGSFTGLSTEQMSCYFDRVSLFFDKRTAFRISTRPDMINLKILSFLSEKKVKTIELGIQSFSDIELSATKRGYTSETAMIACQMIQEHNFDLSVQLSIGLPDACQETYSETIAKLLEIKPKYVRLYPILVLADTEIEKLYREGSYTPLSLPDALNITSSFYKNCVENNIKVIKIGLTTDKENVVAGPYHVRFGELVKAANHLLL
jgi:histone acetyltransferase (RNA polymerase elongator complex component)